MQSPQQIPVNAEAAVLRREPCTLVSAIRLTIKPDCREDAMAQVGRPWDGSPSHSWLWFLSRQIDGPAASRPGSPACGW